MANWTIFIIETFSNSGVLEYMQQFLFFQYHIWRNAGYSQLATIIDLILEAPVTSQADTF